MHFHRFWYRYVSMVPSYDQKTNMLSVEKAFARIKNQKSVRKHTRRRSIIVPGGANNESRGGPGAGFCSPGCGF